MHLETAYEIKLPQFEGPFDLLLFFIERDELDIYNIPISEITNDFLGYIKAMTELNMEVASEFILVASSLMRIKVKMLLPRPELDEQGKEIDPRESLVKQLIEYKKYKAAAEELRILEEKRLLMEKRGNVIAEQSAIIAQTPFADELNHLTLFKLLETYQKVIDRFNKDQNKPKHTVIQYSYTIEGQKKVISDMITANERISFMDFMKDTKDRYHVIFTFMAILEMLQEQVINLTLGLGFNNFWISKKEAA